MSPAEFKQLPALLHRSDLVALGFSNETIDAIKIELNSSTQSVPFGQIGYVRVSGMGYGRYRKLDVAKILGPQWAQA